MLVVKLGGSLAETGRLQAIIDIVAHATLPVVIVPGGGPFADAVRTIQPQLQIPDALAHKLSPATVSIWPRKASRSVFTIRSISAAPPGLGGGRTTS